MIYEYLLQRIDELELCYFRVGGSNVGGSRDYVHSVLDPTTITPPVASIPGSRGGKYGIILLGIHKTLSAST